MSFKAVTGGLARSMIQKGKYKSFKTAKQHAGAIIAAGARNASAAAKKANPNLAKVKG
jgi:hypothetical protein